MHLRLVLLCDVCVCRLIHILLWQTWWGHSSESRVKVHCNSCWRWLTVCAIPYPPSPLPLPSPYSSCAHIPLPEMTLTRQRRIELNWFFNYLLIGINSSTKEITFKWRKGRAKVDLITRLMIPLMIVELRNNKTLKLKKFQNHNNFIITSPIVFKHFAKHE